MQGGRAAQSPGSKLDLKFDLKLDSKNTMVPLGHPSMAGWPVCGEVQVASCVAFFDGFSREKKKEWNCFSLDLAESWTEEREGRRARQSV